MSKCFQKIFIFGREIEIYMDGYIDGCFLNAKIVHIWENIDTHTDFPQLDSNPENRLERMKKKELPKKFSSGNVLKWQENWSDPLLALVFLIIQSGMSTVVR